MIILWVGVEQLRGTYFYEQVQIGQLIGNQNLLRITSVAEAKARLGSEPIPALIIVENVIALTAKDYRRQCFSGDGDLILLRWIAGETRLASIPIILLASIKNGKQLRTQVMGKRGQVLDIPLFKEDQLLATIKELLRM